MLVVIYIVVVVLGWMVFRVRAEDLEPKDSVDHNSDEPGISDSEIGDPDSEEQ